MVDDHPVVLAGLKALVGADAGLTIVGEARDGRTAFRMAMELVPDVVVLDISLPEMNGIELAAALRAERPECRVLVLTVHEERAYLRQLLELGVGGYLLKRSAADELPRAIHAVAAGGMYLDPAIAGKVVGGLARQRRPAVRADRRAERTRGCRAATGRQRAQQQGDLGAAGYQRQDRRDLQGASDGEARLPQSCRRRPLRGRPRMAARTLTPSGLRSSPCGRGQARGIQTISLHQSALFPSPSTALPGSGHLPDCESLVAGSTMERCRFGHSISSRSSLLGEV